MAISFDNLLPLAIVPIGRTFAIADDVGGAGNPALLFWCAKLANLWNGGIIGHRRYVITYPLCPYP